MASFQVEKASWLGLALLAVGVEVEQALLLFAKIMPGLPQCLK